MSDYYGPLTQTYGLMVTTTSDGNGGLIMTCQLLGTLTVSSSQLADHTAAPLIQRIIANEDIPTNWANLKAYLGE